VKILNELFARFDRLAEVSFAQNIQIQCEGQQESAAIMRWKKKLAKSIQILKNHVVLPFRHKNILVRLFSGGGN
jgi:hypothetical protein